MVGILIRGYKGMKQALINGTLTRPMSNTVPSGWSGGLVTDPSDFSDQLSRLQASLERANAPNTPQPGDPAYIAGNRSKRP
jgi:hypothetical protein